MHLQPHPWAAPPLPAPLGSATAACTPAAKQACICLPSTTLQGLFRVARRFYLLFQQVRGNAAQRLPVVVQLAQVWAWHLSINAARSWLFVPVRPPVGPEQPSLLAAPGAQHTTDAFNTQRREFLTNDNT